MNDVSSIVSLLLLKIKKPCNAYSEYLAEKKHLGGLLILLPTKDVAGNNDDKVNVKSVLAELEKLLLHEEVPVSHEASPFLIKKCGTYS
jgi:hypothetical protein